jgi:predicted transcriptional regulator
MEAPCQKIVWDVLPALRAAVAVELVKNGVSQVESARMLEIAPSAVSQYLSGKRGYRIEFRDDIRHSITELARDLKEGNVENLVQRICAICREIRDSDEEPDSSPAGCGVAGKEKPF